MHIRPLDNVLGSVRFTIKELYLDRGHPYLHLSNTRGHHPSRRAKWCRAWVDTVFRPLKYVVGKDLKRWCDRYRGEDAYLHCTKRESLVRYPHNTLATAMSITRFQTVLTKHTVDTNTKPANTLMPKKILAKYGKHLPDRKYDTIYEMSPRGLEMALCDGALRTQYRWKGGRQTTGVISPTPVEFPYTILVTIGQHRLLFEEDHLTDVGMGANGVVHFYSCVSRDIQAVYRLAIKATMDQHEVRVVKRLKRCRFGQVVANVIKHRRGVYYIAMPKYESTLHTPIAKLRDIFSQYAYPIPEDKQWASEAALAVHYQLTEMHRLKIWYTDVKPSNILVRVDPVRQSFQFSLGDLGSINISTCHLPFCRDPHRPTDEEAPQCIDFLVAVTIAAVLMGGNTPWLCVTSKTTAAERWSFLRDIRAVLQELDMCSIKERLVRAVENVARYVIHTPRLDGTHVVPHAE